MNNNLAVGISVVVTILMVVLTPIILGSQISGSGEAKHLLSLAIYSIISAFLSGVIESKKDVPNVQYIAMAAMLNFFGVGVGVYLLLINDPKANL